MEIMCRIYRDRETGKIWQHIGGQEPVEIDESFAKMLNLDIDSIPFLEKENDIKIICPNCGNAVAKTPFCPECGTKLPD